MTVTTHVTISFSFSFVFTRDVLTLQHTVHRYFLAHSFYAYLAPPIVVGVLLTCQSLDPEYKTHFQEKDIVLYSGQYGNTIKAIAH